MFIVHGSYPPKRAAQWRRAARSLIFLPWDLAVCLFVPLRPSPGSPTQKEVATEPPYIPLSLHSNAANAQSQSTLLTLPAELRCKIWKCLLTEKHVAMYYRSGRIAYEFLESEGPYEVANITPAVIEAVRTNSAASLQSKRGKTNILAVLQRCQMIYRETIDMLYEANTFAILHNTVLIDFRRAALASHLSRIRSLHIHFQFRELDQHRWPLEEQQGFPCPWSLNTFSTCGNEPDIARAIRGFPNLGTLSVFIQGPLTSEYTYRRICDSLRSIQRDLKSLRFMMVRFPRPFPDEVVQLRAQYDGQDSTEHVKCVLEKEEAGVLHGCRIVQPSLEPEQNVYDMADSDVESKWRVETIYMKSSGDADGIVTRNYAVLRLEKETKTYKTDPEFGYFQIPVVKHKSPDDLYGSKYRALNWPPKHDGRS